MIHVARRNRTAKEAWSAVFIALLSRPTRIKWLIAGVALLSESTGGGRFAGLVALLTHARCKRLAAVVCMVVAIGALRSTGVSATELIINEALANEPGRLTSQEWIEITNWPDSGDLILSLAGYRFVDGNDTTIFDTGILIAPGQFVILARQPVGQASFEARWGNNSGVWGDTTSESYPVVAAKMSLRNSTDTVTLISPFGGTSSILWTRQQEDGISWERIRPDSDDQSESFSECRDPAGATPGRVNSVAPEPFDLRLDSITVTPASPIWGAGLVVSLHIANTGLGPAGGLNADLYEDMDPASPGTSLTLLQSVTDFPGGPLAPGNATIINLPRLDLTPGLHWLYAELEADGNPADNSIRTAVTVRHSHPLIVISEFLANPSDGPGEWIEICNRADFSISLRSVEIGDRENASVISPFAGAMPPGAYWVLAEEESTFRAYYPRFSGEVFGVAGWRNLNNDGDLIRLIGAGGEIIDSLTFQELPDENHSLERISLSPMFANPDDWVRSVDPSGATPGRANSVIRDLAGAFTVTVAPNPFSIRADESVEISYQMEIGEALTLKFFDRSGRLVRTIADEVPAATGSVRWDGADDHGTRVRPGPYVLLARSDPAGAVYKSVVVVAP